MNRNSQAHFAKIPSMDISRSKFDRSFNHTTTGNLGELIPVFVDPDIVPGDTVTMKQADLIRMLTPLAPTMGELKADFYWWFVPNRLVWDNFKKFWGENDTAPWIQTTEYQIPQIKIMNHTNGSEGKKIHTVLKGSLLDHMGIPTNYSWKIQKDTVTDPDTEETTYRNISISALPTRAYCLIWNEFFRSEALQNPVNIPKNDSNVNLFNSDYSVYITDPEAYTISNEYAGGLPCLKVCKTFDYFSAALPSAQAGPDVTLPMNGQAPINYNDLATTKRSWDKHTALFDAGIRQNKNSSGTDINSYSANNTLFAHGYIDDNGTEVISPKPGGTSYDVSDANDKFSLYADLTQATGATINQLRTAFAIQKWQEREARGGQRYIESVLSHYRVSNPDYRLQRPEYLGGYTHQIQINQVLSQGNDTSGAPIGTTGAYSLSIDTNGDVFSHSFTEHGILMCVMCIRQNHHVYQQGINRAWLKKDRVDFYTPEFANLGETYIKEIELYAQGTSEDNDAFGYQERWAEMRYMPDMVSGAMRSDYPYSLDIWHYADYYTEKPQLGNKWIKEDDSNLLRTLAIQDEDQFKIDINFGAIYTRPLPMFSVPGLLDHH